MPPCLPYCTFLNDKKEIVLDLKHYRIWENMVICLERIGILLKDMKGRELYMVDQDGDIIESYEWAREIGEGTVVRLGKPKDHNIVYWGDASGKMRTSNNDKFSNEKYAGPAMGDEDEGICERCGDRLYRLVCMKERRSIAAFEGCEECGARPNGLKCAIYMSDKRLAAADARKPRKPEWKSAEQAMAELKGTEAM
jgi:hypothetical protein